MQSRTVRREKNAGEETEKMRLVDWLAGWIVRTYILIRSTRKIRCWLSRRAMNYALIEFERQTVRLAGRVGS